MRSILMKFRRRLAFNVAGLVLVLLLIVRRWRRRAVVRAIAAHLSDDERAALSRVLDSTLELVDHARRLHAEGAWPAAQLELDLVTSGGGFRAAAALAGAALVYALEREGLLAGVPRARGASAGSFCGLAQLPTTFTAGGLVGFLIRQPRFFRECVGVSVLWRLILPFEVWYAPSTLHGILSPGDAQVLSGRVRVPYVRGRLSDGLRETEVSQFCSNEAVMRALSKSMMLPFVYGVWNMPCGYRDGEIVMDGLFSRNTPLFLDGLRPQLVLMQRPEVPAMAPAALETMADALIAGQREVFELLRRVDTAWPAADTVGAVEMVPAGMEPAQVASARLNAGLLVVQRLRRALRVSPPDLQEGDTAEAWRLQQAQPPKMRAF